MSNNCTNHSPIISEIVLTALKLKGISTGHKQLLLHSGKLEKTTDSRAAEFAGECFLLYYDFEFEGVPYKGYLGIDKELNLVSISELKPTEKDHYIFREKIQILLTAAFDNFRDEILEGNILKKRLNFLRKSNNSLLGKEDFETLCQELSVSDIDSLLYCYKNKIHCINNECHLKNKRSLITHLIKKAFE